MKETKKYWTIAKPNMTQQEVRKVLKALLEIDSARDMYNKYSELEKQHNQIIEAQDSIIEELQSKSMKTVEASFAACVVFHKFIKHIVENNNIDITKEQFQTLDEAYEKINSISDIWPEFVVGKPFVVKEDTDE